MAAQGGGISGTAVAAATAGGVLIYASLRNVTPLHALRDVLSGNPPAVQQQTAGMAAISIAEAAAGAVQAAGSGGGSIVTAARKYIGVPYRWGGASPSGFDCSGLVTWVLHHDLGIDLPSNTHTVTGQFLLWGGAVTVPAASRQPGDLVCWSSHIAIYSGGSQMIEAPGAGKLVRETKLRTAGATFRRVRAAGSVASGTQSGTDTSRGGGHPI